MLPTENKTQLDVCINNTLYGNSVKLTSNSAENAITWFDSANIPVLPLLILIKTINSPNDFNSVCTFLWTYQRQNSNMTF